MWNQVMLHLPLSAFFALFSPTFYSPFPSYPNPAGGSGTAPLKLRPYGAIQICLLLLLLLLFYANSGAARTP